jgi:hypothetical protein
MNESRAIIALYSIIIYTRNINIYIYILYIATAVVTVIGTVQSQYR